MKAEDQSMLIEEAQGQKTIQALFVQTGKKQVPVIQNIVFELDEKRGEYQYVFAGTEEHYLQFRQLMEDYAVFPAHEVPGHPANPATPRDGAEVVEEAPVVDTAPNNNQVSTLDEAPLDLSATEGEIVLPPQGGENELEVRGSEQSADSGQSASGEGGAPSGASAGDRPDDGGGHGAEPAPGGGEGREAPAGDGASAQREQVGATDDPFAGI